MDRAVRVLDFLAAHPGQQFSLAELCRRLQISKATGHSLLATLTARSYLIRDPGTQTYCLGPALLPVAEVAWRGAGPLRQTRQVADALSVRLGVECVTSIATHDEILVLTHSGLPQPRGITGRPGARLPLAPPFGTVFMAWAEPRDVDLWLARLGARAPDSARRRCSLALAAARDRGYAVGFHSPAYVRLCELYAAGAGDMDTQSARDAIDQVMADMTRDEYLRADALDASALPLIYVAVPVFDANARLLFALSIMGARLTGADIEWISGELLQAAGEVMRSTDGRRPDVAYLGSD